MEKSQIHFFNFFNFNLTETKLKKMELVCRSLSQEGVSDVQ